MLHEDTPLSQRRYRRAGALIKPHIPPVRPGGRPRETDLRDVVDTTSGGPQRGRDHAKSVDGRKRHIVVDSMGLLLAVLVTAASVDDAQAGAELFARLEG